MNKETDDRLSLHILIREKFFLNKVGPAVFAVGFSSALPDWEQENSESLLKSLLAVPAVGAVVDLEEDSFDMMAVIRGLRADDRFGDLPILAYCSHEKTELVAEAEAMGAQTVARSTFAADLARILMALLGDGEEEAGKERGS